MTNNEIITTTHRLIESFAKPMPMLNIQIADPAFTYDAERTALHALDAAIDAALLNAPKPIMNALDYLCDDAHDDPFYHLAYAHKFADFDSIDDYAAAPDMPIMTSDILEMIACELLTCDADDFADDAE